MRTLPFPVTVLVPGSEKPVSGVAVGRTRSSPTYYDVKVGNEVWSNLIETIVFAEETPSTSTERKEP